MYSYIPTRYYDEVVIMRAMTVLPPLIRPSTSLMELMIRVRTPHRAFFILTSSNEVTEFSSKELIVLLYVVFNTCNLTSALVISNQYQLHLLRGMFLCILFLCSYITSSNDHKYYNNVDITHKKQLKPRYCNHRIFLSTNQLIDLI